MDSFELNKFAGAALAALLLWFGAKTVADGLFHHEPEKAGYVVAVADTSGDDDDKKPVEKGPSVAELIATADAEAGKKELKKCTACHTFDKDGKNKSGPKLWGIYEREVASVDGFGYSKALKDKGGKWDVEFLACFLQSPKKCVKGTKMAFAGIKKPKKLADVIKYLSTLK